MTEREWELNFLKYPEELPFDAVSFSFDADTMTEKPIFCTLRSGCPNRATWSRTVKDSRWAYCDEHSFKNFQ